MTNPAQPAQCPTAGFFGLLSSFVVLESVQGGEKMEGRAGDYSVI